MSWPSAGVARGRGEGILGKGLNQDKVRASEELKEGLCGWKVVNKEETGAAGGEESNTS